VSQQHEERSTKHKLVRKFWATVLENAKQIINTAYDNSVSVGYIYIYIYPSQTEDQHTTPNTNGLSTLLYYLVYISQSF
jgi:hypothetical protein